METYRSGKDWVRMAPDDRNKYLFSQYSFDPRGNNELGTMFQQFGASLYPQVGDDLQFMEKLGPERQRALLGMINDLDYGTVDADMAAYDAAADENAAQSARSASLMGRASGLGDGFIAGQQSAAFGQAAAQKNAYHAQQMSPQARIGRAAALLQAIEGGVNSPAMQMQMSLFSPIETRHASNQAEIGSGSAFMPFLQGLSTLNSVGSTMAQMGWHPFAKSTPKPIMGAPPGAVYVSKSGAVEARQDDGSFEYRPRYWHRDFGWVYEDLYDNE